MNLTGKHISILRDDKIRRDLYEYLLNLAREQSLEGSTHFYICHNLGEIFGKSMIEYDKSHIKKYLPELWSSRSRSVSPTSIVLWSRGINSRINALEKALSKMS